MAALTEEQKARNRAKVKAWREANPEKMAAQKKAYREANREKMADYRKAYREANREKMAAQEKAYREANSEKRNAQKKAYRKANAEISRVYDKHAREKLVDRYVASQLGIPVAKIPSEIIEAKREQLLLFRTIREFKSALQEVTQPKTQPAELAD